MKVIILPNKEKVVERASKIISTEMKKDPSSVLSIASGNTVLPLFKKIISMNKAKRMSFSEAKAFTLDDYSGIGKKSKKSYSRFMKDNLFDKIDIKKDDVHYLTDKTLKSYEDEIKKSGGIDLMVLGIGTNGHIAFNEPGSSFRSKTRKVRLSKETREYNSREFKSIRDVPKSAVTVGIGTILKSKKIILLATGRHKADAVAKAVESGVTKSVPASALQKHKNITFIVDKNSASKLRRELLLTLL